MLFLIGEIDAEPDLRYRLVNELQGLNPVPALVRGRYFEIDPRSVQVAEGLLHVRLVSGLGIRFPEHIKSAHEKRGKENAR
jgi:hypothetical protein